MMCIPSQTPRSLGSQTRSSAVRVPLSLLSVVLLALATCAHDSRSRQIRAFHPYVIGPRPVIDADVDPAIVPYVGRIVWVSPEGTGIDTLRSCYALGIAYMRNQSRTNLDPYRIESVRHDDRFSHLLVAVLRGPKDATEKLWFENRLDAFLEELGEDFHLDDPIAAHPDWDAATWNSIRIQVPGQGMSPDMVRLAIGEPATVEPASATPSTSSGDAAGGSRWVYPWFGAVLTFDAQSRLASAEVEDPWL